MSIDFCTLDEYRFDQLTPGFDISMNDLQGGVKITLVTHYFSAAHTRTHGHISCLNKILHTAPQKKHMK